MIAPTIYLLALTFYSTPLPPLLEHSHQMATDNHVVRSFMLKQNQRLRKTTKSKHFFDLSSPSRLHLIFPFFPYSKIPPNFLFSFNLKSILIKVLSSPHHRDYFCQNPQWLPYCQIHQLLPCPLLTRPIGRIWYSWSCLPEILPSLRFQHHTLQVSLLTHWPFFISVLWCSPMVFLPHSLTSKHCSVPTLLSMYILTALTISHNLMP